MARCPIVMAAIDVEKAAPELLEQMQETVRRSVDRGPIIGLSLAFQAGKPA